MTSVAELHTRAWPVIVDRVRSGTARAYRSAWNMRLEPTLGHVDVTTITTLTVEETYATWTGAFTTRNDALYLLGSLCRYAVEAGLIPTNPCIGVDRRKDEHRDPTERSLTRSEIQTLFSLLPSSGPYRRFVLAMLYTACRLGEIAGMRVSDVD